MTASRGPHNIPPGENVTAGYTVCYQVPEEADKCMRSFRKVKGGGDRAPALEEQTLGLLLEPVA